MMADHENHPSSGSPAPRPERHARLVAGRQSSGETNLAGEAGDQATRLVSEVIDQTAKLAGQAWPQISRLMTEQKNRAADGLATVLRNKTRNGQQNPESSRVANYTYWAAVRMDSTATYLRGADFPTMLRFARRPEILVVGTIVTGLLVARFLKASRRDATKPWRSVAGRWNETLQKGAHVVSSVPDTLREGAGARGMSAAAVVENIAGPRLGKQISMIGDRLMDHIVRGNMKATTLLKNDHAAVNKLFADFGRTTAKTAKRRQALIDDIANELEIHSTIEEEIFYPAVKGVRGGQSLVSEAKPEHKKVDALVAEAQGKSMATDEVVQKVMELRDAVVHHATEEEREMFPVAEEGLGDRLEELGEQMVSRKLGEQMVSRKKELQTSRLQKAKRAGLGQKNCVKWTIARWLRRPFARHRGPCG